MWQAEITTLNSSETKYKIRQHQTVLSFNEVFNLLQKSRAFACFFNTMLAASPFTAYFWEVKPVTSRSIEEEFEFVLVNSSALINIQANSADFEKYFHGQKYAASFLNLGKDAMLIAPVGIAAPSNYAHLARFVRNAPEEQTIAFWNLVSSEFLKAVDDKMKWLSTSGLGVHWLHVRIDKRPKYYNHGPYKARNSESI